MDIKNKSFGVTKNRAPHQGKREIARRLRQAAKQAQKAAAKAA